MIAEQLQRREINVHVIACIVLVQVKSPSTVIGTQCVLTNTIQGLLAIVVGSPSQSV